MDILTWPPDITIKKHPRARHVKLKASVQHGLELVVPVRFNSKEIPFILEQNRPWIEKQLAKLQTKEPLIESNFLPSTIIFPAIDQTWSVEYVPSRSKLQMIRRPHYQLILLGDISNTALCKKLLIYWIKNQAKHYLLEQLQLISQQTNLSYTKATIRDQSTRWGSCSSKKSINLNYKLLFFPYELMRNIMIHELCHTVHLNHSTKFWQLVEKWDPNLKTHQKQLRKANDFVPTWITQQPINI